MSVQEQYTETVKQGQQAFAGAVDSWIRTVQDVWGQFPVADPYETIDRFYATTGRLLEAQRDLAKGLVRTTTSFADSVRHETQTAADEVQHAA
jgi:hypothetical protein